MLYEGGHEGDVPAASCFATAPKGLSNWTEKLHHDQVCFRVA